MSKGLVVLSQLFTREGYYNKAYEVLKEAENWKQVVGDEVRAELFFNLAHLYRHFK